MVHLLVVGAGGDLGAADGAGCSKVTMICPHCQSDNGSKVVNSRDFIEVRYRRHLCDNCKGRFTTYEISAVQYDKIRAIQVNTREFDSVIASLRAIKVQFGDDNGTAKD